MDRCEEVWYASDNNLRGTPRGSRKNPNAGGSPQTVSRRPCCAVALRKTAWSEHGMGAAWAWHGKCGSDTAALCKSNGKDTFWTLSGTAWQGNGMGMACCVNRPSTRHVPLSCAELSTGAAFTPHPVLKRIGIKTKINTFRRYCDRIHTVYCT